MLLEMHSRTSTRHIYQTIIKCRRLLSHTHLLVYVCIDITVIYIHIQVYVNRAEPARHSDGRQPTKLYMLE